MLTAYHLDLSDDSFGHALTHSFFSVASILTTTGFITVDYERWGNLAVAIIFIAMLVGGNAGSTAGGIKVIRYVIIFKTLFAEFKKILHPNALISIYIDKQNLKESVLSTTFGFFFLFTMTIVFLTIYLYARGFDTMTSISASLAIVGNIGPGFAHVGPSENFSFFSDIDKLIFSFGMIVGRLECFTVFILLSKSFWSKF
jgi:trk system potassium uptake protein TrkH